MSIGPTRPRDRGFTLPETMIAAILMGTIAAVIGMAIIVSLRALPTTKVRADTAIAVQALTTWLPPDVDSTEPGEMDVDPATASGCAGADPGINLLRLKWAEQFKTVTTVYVADYRFVVTGPNTAKIVRVACSGTSSLGAPTILDMTAPLATTVPTVTPLDTDGDGLDDQVKFSVVTKSGDTVYIDAASKNPHETLPPVSAYPTTTTTTTTIPNNPPTAAPMNIAANPSSPITFTLAASDPDGDPLTVDLDNVPSGWTYVIVGLDVTLTPGPGLGTFVIDYEVEDPPGGSASSTITVVVTSTPTTTSTSTTTTSTSSTTTTLPPCIVSSMSVTPNPVDLKFSDPSKLKKTVAVEITLGGGYCIGLTLQYDTGAPNGQYVQNFGTSAPYVVSLIGHPSGTELWSAGTHTLEVRDGFDNLLASATLTVNP